MYQPYVVGIVDIFSEKVGVRERARGRGSERWIEERRERVTEGGSVGERKVRERGREWGVVETEGRESAREGVGESELGSEGCERAMERRSEWGGENEGGREGVCKWWRETERGGVGTREEGVREGRERGRKGERSEGGGECEGESKGEREMERWRKWGREGVGSDEETERGI